MIADRGTQRLFPPKYIENTFRLSKLLNSMQRHSITTTVQSSTGQLESFRSKLQGLQYFFFENFEIFSDLFSITISYPKILIPFIWRKPVSYRRVTLPAFTHAVIISPWPSWLGYVCEPFTDTDQISSCVRVSEVLRPPHFASNFGCFQLTDHENWCCRFSPNPSGLLKNKLHHI